MNYLDIRVKQLLGDISDLRKCTVGGLTPSTESISQDIKAKADKVLDFHSDLIKANIAELLTLINDFDLTKVDQFTTNGHTLKKLLSREFNLFGKRGPWYKTDEEIAEEQAPVLSSFSKLFTIEQDEELLPDVTFDTVTDMKEVKVLINKSPNLTKVPRALLIPYAGVYFRRVHNLNVALVKAIKEQEETLNELLKVVETKLKLREDIGQSESLDLDAASSTCLGKNIYANAVVAVNRIWYKNNLTTPIGKMGDNIKLMLDEPLDGFKPYGTTTDKLNVDVLITNLIDEDLPESVRATLRSFMDLMDLIRPMIGRLVDVVDAINLQPSKTKEGYYNYALEDIAILVSQFSGILYNVVLFSKGVYQGIVDGVKITSVINELLSNHIDHIERYISRRDQ